MGNQFVIIDTVACQFSEFASRQDAERECDARNGVVKPKTSEPAEIQLLREKFRREGFLTQEEHEALHRPRTRDLIPIRLPRDPRLLIEPCRKLLQAWVGELCRRSGLHDRQRRSMSTNDVITAIAVGAEGSAICSLPYHRRLFDALNDRLMPLSWSCLEAEGLRGVLAVHYLSNEPARLKADYLGLSERSYFRKLAEAHLWLAKSLGTYLTANDLDWHSLEDIDRYNAAPDDSHSGDDGYSCDRARKNSEGFWWAVNLDDVDSGRFDD